MENKNTATGKGLNLPISTKYSIEIAREIMKKPTEKAKKILQDCIDKKIPIAVKRFTEGAGHKRGDIAAGKYPVKASKEILKILNQVEANARDKGLDSKQLIISEIKADKASNTPRYGRRRGIRARRTHIKITLKEYKIKKDTKESKKEEGKK